MPVQLSQPGIRWRRQSRGGVLPFAVDGLAAYRLTRLATRDAVLTAPRDALLNALQRRERSLAAYFVQCPWCMGVWISVAVTAARQFMPGWGYVANALALATVVGLLSELAST